MCRLFVRRAGTLWLGVLITLGATGTRAAGDDEYEYVGTKTCKKCHFEVWQSWAKTKMANSFHVLKPDAELKPSKKTGLDSAWIEQIKTNKGKGDPKIEPAKDYTRDTKCLKCHTTGYGEVGGYEIPAEKDKKAQRKAEKLQGVGCESCHGPGSAFVKIFQDIQDKERPYSPDELYKAGLIKVTEKTCAKCHNTDSPLVGDDYVFDYEKRKDQGTHEHFPLKLRKG